MIYFLHYTCVLVACVAQTQVQAGSLCEEEETKKTKFHNILIFIIKLEVKQNFNMNVVFFFSHSKILFKKKKKIIEIFTKKI